MSEKETRLIAARYRLLGRLGRGGMGTVWCADDELLGRRVAVKELHPEDSPGGRGASPYTSTAAPLREARAVARVKHPHVVVVHDVVVDDGLPYIVMELVDGGSLAERIARRGPVGVAEAARIGLALLGALRAAHELGVLHRDLKPANVLLEEATGRVVLTDFGIAQLTGSTTITEVGSFVGSPEYTAPERMQGATAGPASDLWSLGVLLCAALCGESPFRRDSLGGILHAVVEAEITLPTQAEPLRPLVLGLLERDPALRLDAAEAERLLRTYVATGSLPSRDVHSAPTSHVVRPAPASEAPTPMDSAVAAPAPAPARAAAPAPAPAPVGRGRRRAPLLAAAALVAALAGAGGATAVLMQDDGTGTAAPGPSATDSTPPVRTAKSPVADPAPTVTVTSSPAPAAKKPPAPAGYLAVVDPDGFALAVPEGFSRSEDDKRVYYMDADQAVRIGIRAQRPVPDGPLGSMRRSDADGPHTNPGYRDGKVTPTTHNGLTAALWEFTWKGFSQAEGARHTIDVCWEENGRMYDVWVSAPVGRLDEARRHFDTALDSFTPPG